MNQVDLSQPDFFVYEEVKIYNLTVDPYFSRNPVYVFENIWTE